ncbi:hypothetical protein M9Y10_029835 [Tritrichomonas musculus]|uniref:Uncharacterized protein n=1 Tax=Tritrichomonas musculus TaxID=1915356 RepID=A0ABR2KPA6_9EUKA
MNATSSDDDNGQFSQGFNSDPFAVTKSNIVTKTYFYVQDSSDGPSKYYERKWPHEFMFTKNTVFIHVIHCRCLFSNAMLGDVELHANFIERDNYLDSFVCFTKTLICKYKKYKVMKQRYSCEVT